MRILGIIDSFNLGGAETQLSQMLGFLAAGRQHECLACSLLPPPPHEVAFSESVRRVYLNKTSAFSLPHVTLSLTRLIRQFNPTVAYSRLPLANGLTRIATLLSGRRVRHVAGVDTVPAVYTPAYTWKHPGSLVFRWLERYATCIVCNSHGTAKAVVEAGYPSAHIRVVPNGIDINRFRPGPTRPASKRPQLLCVASLRPEKGVARLVEVLAPLLQAHRVDLKVVGDGEERGKIEQVVADLGVGHAVQLLGADADVLPALHDADIYVSAALVEGFGISVAEAAATGLPAVAFAAPGGLSEVIVDQVTGVLIAAEEPDDFRAAVDRLCSDVERRKRMGSAAREHIVQRFALPRVATALLACFGSA